MASLAPSITDEDEEVWLEDKEGLAGAWGNLEEIRRAGELCDVRLEVEGRGLSAHRVVLAATIPYFRAMFTSDMQEAQQHTITIQGVEAETLEQLVNFAYSGRVRITASNVQSLMMGASFLQLTPIVTACSAFLQSRLQGSNVIALRAFATAMDCGALRRAADRFLQKHFVVVSKTDEFRALPLPELLSILRNSELHIQSEEQVFEAALGWVSQDVECRKDAMPEILACIRLPLLRPHYISDIVAANPLVRDDLKCRDLVDEAKDYHLLPERRPLLQTFITKPRCCDDVPGVIYAVGGLTNSGDSLSTVEMYDTLVGRWNSIEPMSTLRSRVGVAVMRGLLYAIGGFNGHERLRTVEVFHPESRVWREVAPLNNKRSALGSAVCGERLYVCGGYDGITSLSTVEVYDSDTNRWHLTSPMSKQRSASGIAVLDGKIYILGGHDGMSIFNSVEVLDPETGQWRPVKPMLSRRCRLGACALNGKVSSVEVLDPETGQWRPVKPMLSRRCRLGACALNGKVYVCGGYDGQQFLKSVEVYDPERDEWSVLEAMNVKRSRVALVANAGSLFAIGGYDGISNLASMEVYSVDRNEWVFGASMQAHEGGVGIGVVPILPPTDIS